MNAPSTDNDTAAPIALAASPRNLYLIIIGVIAGIVLGPGVLLRLSPNTYDWLFVGARQAETDLAAYNAQTDHLARNLTETGVTPEAINELHSQRDPQRALKQMRVDDAYRHRHSSLQRQCNALVLAVLVVMVIESVLPPRRATVARNLAAARFALMAVWVAFVLAQPRALQDTAVGSVAMWVLAAVSLSLIPLLKSAPVPR